MAAAKVVLLGTGSPRPCLERSQPAQLIEMGDQSFVVTVAKESRPNSYGPIGTLPRCRKSFSRTFIGTTFSVTQGSCGADGRRGDQPSMSGVPLVRKGCMRSYSGCSTKT